MARFHSIDGAQGVQGPAGELSATAGGDLEGTYSNYRQGSGYNANAVGNGTFCSWQNTTGTSHTVYGGAVCCRVSAQ